MSENLKDQDNQATHANLYLEQPKSHSHLTRRTDRSSVAIVHPSTHAQR